MSTKQRPAEERRRPGGLRRAAGSDRPFLIALALLVALLAAMALGPLQRYTAAADRVDGLQATRDQLTEQVERLEERRATLEDPEELEIIARTELGLVKPGEVPFVVVSPDDDAVEQVHPEPAEAEPAPDAPWYRRLGQAVGALLDGDG